MEGALQSSLPRLNLTAITGKMLKLGVFVRKFLSIVGAKLDYILLSL